MLDLHPRHIRTAIDYAALHREQIDAEITRNNKAAAHANDRDHEVGRDKRQVFVAAVPDHDGRLGLGGGEDRRPQETLLPKDGRDSPILRESHHHCVSPQNLF